MRSMSKIRLSNLLLISLLQFIFSSNALKFGQRQRKTKKEYIPPPEMPPPDPEIFAESSSLFRGWTVPPTPIALRNAITVIKSIILYKPPLGAASIFVARRLLRSRRRYLQKSSVVLGLAEIPVKQKSKHRGRAFDIDTSDRDYKDFGGVIPVRTKYCCQIINSTNFETDDLELREAAVQVLTFSCPPNGSYESFIQEISKPLSQLYSSLEKKPDKIRYAIIYEVAKIGEVRLLDALLRVLRGNLLSTTRKFDRNKQDVSRRISFYQNGLFGNIFQYARMKTFGTTLEDDRRDLVMAKAAVQVETERLGKVQQILLERPLDLPPTILLHSNESVGKKENTYSKSASSETVTNWNEDAQAWILRARSLFNEIVSEKMSGMDQSSLPREGRETSLAQDLLSLSQFTKKSYVIEETWKTGLFLVDGLIRVQRSEQERILSLVKSLSKELDFFGIPSSLVILFSAQLIHNKVSPHWSAITEFLKKSANIVKGIVIFRFWEPFRDIILDLMNRRPKLLEPFALQNERQSLDNMLRDLDVNDGTPEMRDKGIAAASRLYEKELKDGVIKSAVRGHIVRLLLVQVQILKTSLFDAMESIDHLVDANRLNVQLLASIPAFLLIRWGSILFFTSVFRFRSRDLRPTRDVLTEMSDYLSRMERCLLLSGFSTEGTSEKTMQFAHLGEFVFLTHSYLILLDYICPPTQIKLCDSLQQSVQDLLVQGQFTTSQQLALMKLVNTKHDKLSASLVLL